MLRITALLGALLALSAGLLVATPADATTYHREITGHINASYPAGAVPMRDLTVQLLSIERGGSVRTLHSQRVTEGGTYSFNANLGANKSPSNPFRLRISGIDKDGEARSWYWRGTSGSTTGGSRYIRKASVVQAVASGNFIADFNYGSISGTITDVDNHPLSKAPIIVAAPPPPGSDAIVSRPGTRNRR